ncbi:MAG: hypothetical protein OES57_14175, partial [Acidimicrobiia bacterium]|nr:hypothetical protein [Acidimicrobiia bacterium]
MTAVAHRPLVTPSRRIPSTVGHIIGLGLVFVGAGLLLSLVIEAVTGGDGVAALAASAALFLGIGGGLWRVTRV